MKRIILPFDRISEINKTHNSQIDYVSVENNSPIAGLLKCEVNEMIRWASSPKRGKDALTRLELIVITAYIQGISVSEIARKLKCSRQNVNRAKKSAQRKLCKYPQKTGLITVMIEELGWESVKEYLADLI